MAMAAAGAGAVALKGAAAKGGAAKGGAAAAGGGGGGGLMKILPNVLQNIPMGGGQKGGEGQKTKGGGKGGNFDLEKIKNLFGEKGGKSKDGTKGSKIGKGTKVAGAIGLAQAIGGLAQQRKADRMLPAQEDPEMRSALTQARRRARAFQTGTALAGERAALAQQLGTGQQRMMRYGGGRKGLLQMQQLFNQGIAGLAQQGIAGQTAAQTEANQILEGISQRKLDLQMQRFDIAQARAAQRRAAANRNLGAFLGKTLGVTGGDPQAIDSNEIDTTITSGGTAGGNDKKSGGVGISTTGDGTGGGVGINTTGDGTGGGVGITLPYQ